MSYKPYVPVSRVTALLDEYMASLGISRDELCWELEAGTMVSHDAWCRRLYSWYSGETEAVRFPMVDSIISALGLTDRWSTDLSDIYELVA